MVNAKSSLKKMLTLGVATTMGVLAPLASLTVNAEEVSATEITMTDLFEAQMIGGTSRKGITYGFDNDLQKYVFDFAPGNYKLKSDMAMDSSQYALAVHSGDVTLDLGTNLINYGLAVYATGENTSLTINGNGDVKSEVIACNDAEITINGGRFDDQVVANSEGLVTINEGVFNGNVYAEYKADMVINDGDIYAAYSNTLSSLTINGGDIKTETYVNDDSELTINGGTMKNVTAKAASRGSDLTITGGKIDGKLEVGTKNTLEISGGNVNGNVDVYEAESVSVSGGTISGDSSGFTVLHSGSVNISGGNMSGELSGFTSVCNSEVKLSGGTFTARSNAENNSNDVSGIYFYLDDEATAETIFDDVLVEGYEYSPELEPSVMVVSGQSGNVIASSGSKSFSVVKSGADEDSQAEDKDQDNTTDIKDEDKKDDSSDKQEEKKASDSNNEKKADSADKKEADKKGVSADKKNAETKADKTAEDKFSNEWVDGKWYDADGKQTYKGTLSWKSNEKGWWVEDSEGWYPTSQWVKIDGKWYFFCADGYMDYSEYRDGCWLGADGAWDENFKGGHWMQDSAGWWYEDESGWYPQNQYVWIDGVQYWFNTSGYCA